MKTRNRLISLILCVALMMPVMSFTACSDTVTLSFNSMGGSEVSSIVLNKGRKATEPKNPTKELFVFDGWFTSDTLETRFSFNTKIGVDLTLYAKWVAMSSNVISFNSNGGSYVKEIAEVAGTPITAPEDPTREGFIFGGWYMSEQFLSKYSFNLMPSSDITLHANWLKDEEVARVAFIAREGITSNELRYEIFVELGTTIEEPENLLPETMTSLGWFKEANFVSLFNFSEDKIIADTNLYTYYYSQNLVLDGSKLVQYRDNGRTIVVPHTVTEVADFAFLNNKSIRKVIFNGSITKIGRNAFAGCENLVSINIPSTVESVGSYAFFGCKNLTSISLPSEITVIPDGLFSGCTSLSSLSMSTEITKIGNYSFAECASLSSVTVSDLLTSIGNYSFSGCASLTEFTISKHVTFIGTNAFANCSSLRTLNVAADNEVVASLNGHLVNKAGNTLLLYVSKDGESTFTIPAAITTVSEKAFAGNRTIKSLIIPETVESIACGAFANMAITSITLPNFDAFGAGNEYLAYAFGANNNTANGMFNNLTPNTLTKVEFTDLDDELPTHALYGCAEVKTVLGLDTVKTLGSYSLFSCAAIEDISFLPSLVTIEEFALAYSGVKNMALNATTTTIGEGNFTGLFVESFSVDSANTMFAANKGNLYSKNLQTLIKVTTPTTEFSFENSTRTIKDGAFENCNLINELVIPASVTKIEKGALRRMNGLVDITIPYIGGSAIPSTGEKTDYFAYIFGASMEINSTHENADENGVWENSALYVPVSLNTESAQGFVYLEDKTSNRLPDYAFYNIGHYVLDIHANYTEIGDYTFYGCFNLSFETSVLNIRDYDTVTYERNPNIKKIGKYAFANSSINLVRLAKETEEIGVGAFYKTSMYLVQIPAGALKEIPEDCFYSYFETVEVVENAGMENEQIVTKDVFYSGLELIILPSTLEKIGDRAFYMAGENQYDVTEFAVGFTFAEYNYDTTEWEYVEEQSRLRSIGEEAFYGSMLRGKAINLVEYEPSITSIVHIPASVETIGDRAFAGCRLLRNFEFGSLQTDSRLSAIGSGAFADSFTAALATIKIYSSVAPTVGYGVFSGVSRLTVSFYEGATGTEALQASNVTIATDLVRPS